MQKPETLWRCKQTETQSYTVVILWTQTTFFLHTFAHFPNIIPNQ